MKIAIVNQYPDFKRTVFYQLLQQECKAPLQEVAAHKAGLIIYGPFGRFPKIVGRFVKRKASDGPIVFKNRSVQPISLFHTIENVRHDDKYDFTVGYDFSTSNDDYRFPYWMESLDWSHEGVTRPAPLRISRYFQIAELKKPLGPFLKERTGTCAAFFGQIREPRTTLINAVGRSMVLDTFGPAFDAKIKNSQSSGTFKDDILRNYSYNLCPEKGLFPGYYTEKVLEAFGSGCLPITWAEKNISHDFNSDAFINLLDYASTGYSGWEKLLNCSSSLEKFEAASLLKHTPSIEPLRDFVKKVVQAVV